MVVAETCDIPDKLQQITDVNEDELIIAVLRINNRPIADSIDLYAYQDTYFLPISQLGFLLDLPWELDEDDLRFYSEYGENGAPIATSKLCDFDLSLDSSSKSSKSYWFQDDYDTYLDVETLALLLVGKVAFNDELQQLNFTSAEGKLGLNNSIDTQVNAFFNERDTNVYPIVQDSYQLFTHPIINYRLNMNSQYQDGGSTHNYQANLNATFDLAGLASEYRLLHNSRRTSNFAKFSKNIVTSRSQNTELGNLQTIDDHSIKYEFGDITLLGDELVSSTKQGLGLHVFSHLKNERRNINSIRIEETVLPGWRALLFRNGQFVSEEFVDENNLIVFDEIATFFGINRFSIHLYGPQGQEEFRERVVHVGQNQREHEQLDFAFSMGDTNKTLFNNANSRSNRFGKQLTGSVGYGLTKKLTTEIQWHELIETQDSAEESIEAPTRFVSTSFDYANWSSLFRAKYSRSNTFTNANGQQQSGQAIFMGVNSNISRSFTGNFSVKYLDDFESQLHSADQGLKQEVRLRVNGRTNIPIRMGLGFNFTEQRFKDKALKRLLSVTTNQQLFGDTFSNTLQYKTQANENIIAHSVFLAQRLGNWQVSHSLTWTPFDHLKVERYSVNLRWPQKATTFNETRLTYQSSSSAKFNLSHQFSWRTDLLNLQVGGSIDENGRANVQIGIIGSLYHSRQSNRYEFNQVRGSNARRIEAVTFIDVDGNGVLSEPDEPLPEVQFLGAAEWRNQSTGNNGIAQLFTLSDYQSISIDETSLVDPFLTPTHMNKIVATHAGGITTVHFPMLPVNDFEGKVVSLKNGKETGLLGLTVRLYQEGSEKVWETRTQSDGYYFFAQIPPGKYKIKIDSEHLTRLELVQPTETTAIGSELGDIILVDTIELIEE